MASDNVNLAVENYVLKKKKNPQTFKLLGETITGHNDWSVEIVDKVKGH